MSAAYRIALVYASGFALALLVLGAGVYLAANAELGAQRDQAIAKEIATLSSRPDRPHLLAEIAEHQREMAVQPFTYALFDRRTGAQVGGAMRIAMPAPGHGWVKFVDPEEGADWVREQTVDVPYGDRLTVAIDTDTTEEINEAILRLFAITFGIVLLVSAASGYLLARYLRARLGLIGATARAIVAGDLSRRVPIGRRQDEFEDAGRAVNAMLDRITQLMDNLRQVSSDVAHDLRTPLLRLRAQVERLDTDPDAARHALVESDKLLSLFTAILRINEVEGGAIAGSFASIDLSTLVTDLGESYAPALADGGRPMTFSVEPGIRVQGHAELLAQAISNLLDNSRVHTPSGTAIHLSLHMSDGSAIVTVSDDGPGIPATERQRVLHRFVRTEQSRTTPGSGLGLSLVAAVAKAHHGTVVLDALAPGLRVALQIPLEPGWVFERSAGAGRP